MPSLESLADALKKAHTDESGLPPVERWTPPLSGDLDMRIARDGRWFYLGSEIRRAPLVRLFSTILKREDDDYFLVTPVEKWRIQVEDLPFVALSVERVDDALVFTTNVGSTVVAGSEHPLVVDTDAQTGEPHPRLHVRSNLEALVHRNAFYQLVAWAEEVDGRLQVRSQGVDFDLGALGDD